jgi:hypothetical protein
MGRTNISRAKGSVAPGVSTRHEFGNDDIAALGTDAWRVFKEDVFRLNGIDGAEDFVEEARSLAAEARA